MWGVPRVGRKEAIRFAVGPSLIFLGAGVGSGEWLLGPFSVGKFGFVGIGWIITLSALLQTAYNNEVSRYVIATGEVPVVGFARVPPGRRVWVPLSLFALLAAFINGAWAKPAAKGLFAFVEGRPAGTGDKGAVIPLTFLLLAAVLGIAVASSASPGGSSWSTASWSPPRSSSWSRWRWPLFHGTCAGSTSPSWWRKRPATTSSPPADRTGNCQPVDDWDAALPTVAAPRRP